MSKFIKVKYIGVDRAEIRNGEIYDAELVKGPQIKGMGEALAVVDRSGEAYLYPRNMFEIIENEG